MSHQLHASPRMTVLGPALLLLVTAACGSAERTATSPSAESPSAESPSATAAPARQDAVELAHAQGTHDTHGAATAAPVDHKADVPSPREPPKPPPRERVRLHNECAKNVKLHIERQNDSDLDTSLGNNTSMEERAKDGDEVWLRSEKNDTIDRIVITAAMSEVTIQSGCVKLGSH